MARALLSLVDMVWCVCTILAKKRAQYITLNIKLYINLLAHNFGMWHKVKIKISFIKRLFVRSYVELGERARATLDKRFILKLQAHWKCLCALCTQSHKHTYPYIDTHAYHQPMMTWNKTKQNNNENTRSLLFQCQVICDVLISNARMNWNKFAL